MVVNWFVKGFLAYLSLTLNIVRILSTRSNNDIILFIRINLSAEIDEILEIQLVRLVIKAFMRINAHFKYRILLVDSLINFPSVFNITYYVVRKQGT